MRSRVKSLPLRSHARSVEVRSSGRSEWLSCESVATKDETEAAREDVAERTGFRLARVKRKTTTEKTVEACSRVGMRTKLKLGRVCRLVASWQAQARRGKAKTKARRGEARRVGQGKAKAELESGSLASVLLVFCPPSSPVPEESSLASRRLSSPLSPLSYSLFPLVPSSSFSSCSSSPLSYPALRFRSSPRRQAFLLSSLPIPLVLFFLVLVLFSSFPRFPFFFLLLCPRASRKNFDVLPSLLPSRLFLLLLLPFHKARARPRLITL